MSRLPERIDELLAHVNRGHSGSFKLAGRYAGGEQGAAILVDEAGARYALKFYDAAQLPQLHYAQATTERLREAGESMRQEAHQVAQNSIITSPSALSTVWANPHLSHRCPAAADSQRST